MTSLLAIPYCRLQIYNYAFSRRKENCCFDITCIIAVLIVVFVPETSSKAQSDSSNTTKEKTDGNQNTCFDVNMGQMSRSMILAIMLIRFLFSFSTLVPRANLALVLDSKFQASVVSQGYLTSLQALVGTLTGFMVGPVLSKLYNEEHRAMVFHGGIIHMVIK